MANVGNLGEINFLVACVEGKNKILSFNELSRNSSARFSEHERSSGKSYLEFTGDGLDELSLTIEVDARYGFKPADIQQQLYEMKANGEAKYFVVGGKCVGDNPYVITNITENYKTLHTDGRVIKLSFGLTLKEYANKTAGITNIPERSRPQPVQTAVVKASENADRTYTVEKGDCLFAIARKFYGDGAQYIRIFNANKDKIESPDMIYPGQVLLIPG